MKLLDKACFVCLLETSRYKNILVVHSAPLNVQQGEFVDSEEPTDFLLSGYHMQMVELFAEYDPMGLLPFLRASERYPLEEVMNLDLEVCRCIQYSHVMIICFDMFCMAQRAFKSLCLLAGIFSKRFAGSGRVPAERFASSPKHSSVSPSDMLTVAKVRKLLTYSAVPAECQTH